MYRLIYLSTASEDKISDSDLTNLLLKSQKSNRTIDITGILLHKNGEFIQVLEGEKKSVLDLFEKIKKDKRHKNLIAFDQKEIDKRYFTGYFMAFNDSHFDKINKFESLRDFNQDKILKSDKDDVIIFLKTFLEAHKKYTL
jgi:Sensors of blue-light using FAD